MRIYMFIHIDSGSLIQEGFTENLSWNILQNTKKKPCDGFSFLKKTLQYKFFSVNFPKVYIAIYLKNVASVSCG